MAVLAFTPVNMEVIREAQAQGSAGLEMRLMGHRLDDDAVSAVRAALPAVVVVTLSEAEHLRDLVSFCNGLDEDLKWGGLVLTVITRMEQAGVDQILRKLRCTEKISAHIKAKALWVKLERYDVIARRSWDRRTKSQGGVIAPDLGQRFRADGRGDGESNDSRLGHILSAPPLTIEDDCWLAGLRSVRMIRGLWLVRIAGPGLTAGRWERLDRLQTTLEGKWEWIPLLGAQDPYVRRGKWIFCGRKPEFIEDRWQFLGGEPSLEYWQAQVRVAQRFYCDAKGDLVITQNSWHAEAKRKVIEQSLRRALVLDREFSTEELEAELNAERKVLGAQHFKRSQFRNATPGASPFPKPTQFGHPPAGIRLPQGNELFRQLTDPDLRFNFISESIISRSAATLWVRGQRWRGECRINSYDAKNERILFEYPSGWSRDRLLGRLRELKADAIYFNLRPHRSALFFVMGLPDLLFDHEGCRARVPNALFEVQRRAEFRLVFPSTHGFTLRTPEGIFEVVDLSAGGARIISDLTFQPQWVRGQEIRYVEFEVDAQLVRTRARVRWHAESRDVLGRLIQKVGIQFLDLDEAAADWVRLYTLERNYDFWLSG